MPAPGFPPSIFEFFIEEVGVVLGLFSTRAVTRFPDMTWIIAYGGGALPPIIERFCNFETAIFGGKVELPSDKMKEVLQRQFYFNLAGFPLPDQIHGLMRLVGHTRLLYGSDYPYSVFHPLRVIIGTQLTFHSRLGQAMGVRALTATLTHNQCESVCMEGLPFLTNYRRHN